MSNATVIAFVLAASAAQACAGVKTGSSVVGSGGSGAAGTTAVGGGSGSSGTPAGGGAPGGGYHDCVNLECQQTTCLVSKCLVPACGELQNPETTLSGTIYDPAGRLPLYNVAVYVPNAPLDQIPEGVSCMQCAGTASGKPIAAAVTDASGKFVLKNPPVGTNIPLVIQVGKWRREVVVPKIDACTANVLADVNLSRLPRNQAEGHIPQIAITTGHADALDCLLRKIGIDEQEFTTDAGSGRVHMFVGGSGTAGQGANSFAASGVAFPNASTLWGSMAKLLTYDIMVLSCEGAQYATAKMPYLANIKQYADRGGRIFDDHLHFYWIYKGVTPWPTTAAWIGVGADLGNITASIDTTFPKGNALADWLVVVGASPTRGLIDIIMAQHSVNAANPPISQRWIYLDSPASVQYLTFNTPVEAPPDQQCGRVVFTDIHVSTAASGSDVSHPDTPFPTGCTTSTLTPQEKALEFMFFDLSSCVQIDSSTPQPPPVIP